MKIYLLEWDWKVNAHFTELVNSEFELLSSPSLLRDLTSSSVICKYGCNSIKSKSAYLFYQQSIKEIPKFPIFNLKIKI